MSEEYKAIVVSAIQAQDYVEEDNLPVPKTF
jgi:hypothetical protein